MAVLRLLVRSIREPGYRRNLAQRFGSFRSRSAGDVIWIHAVSAGETIAAVPLIEKLLARGHHCLVTNMTPTGRERVASLLGDRVENCYAPYDLPGAVRRFLLNNRPKLLIVIDTELWPNMLHISHGSGVPTALVNGRLSARSAARYAKFPGMTHELLQNLDLLCVQTTPQAERFLALGARTERLQVTGSIKFDALSAADDGKLSLMSKLVDGRQLLLGASTHAGEEVALLEAFQQLHAEDSQRLLVLAPRHSPRVPEVVQLCGEAGFDAALFSETDLGLNADSMPRLSADILIIDVMGELDAFFRLAPVAFVGGSLAPVGGHNLLEAVRADAAVIMGPHLDNIDDIARQFEEAGAMKIVQDSDDLTAALVELYGDPSKANAMANAASEVFTANRGALGRSERLLIDLMQA